jgi:hypothetical protein
MAEFTLLALGLWFVLKPEIAIHTFFPKPRLAVVRLLGAVLLLLCAWLLFLRI